MIPYLKIAALVAAFLLGGFASYYAIERPAVASREVIIADLKAASAENKATFEKQAADKQREYDHAIAQKDAAYDTVVRDKDADLARVIAVGSGVQHNVDVRLRADRARRLSAPAGAVCPVDDTAPALGELLKGAADLATKRTADAERLADQVRGLQDAIKATP